MWRLFPVFLLCRSVLLVGAHPTPLAHYTEIVNVALALCLLPFAIYTTGQKGFRTDGMMADLSYIIYLLHGIALDRLGAQSGLSLRRLAAVAVTVAAVIVVAVFLWAVYDKPINRLRSAWVRKQIRAAELRASEMQEQEAVA